MLTVATCLSAVWILGAGTMRKVKDVIGLLENAGNEVIVLTGRDKDRVVVVTPSLVGRVLCTGFEGVNGGTESYISEAQIKRGATPSGKGGDWAAFGGEERIWLAPEGGRFGLFFKQGNEQNFKNYLVPEPLNSARFGVTARTEDQTSVTFVAPIHLTNYQGHKIDLEVKRRIEILESCPYTLGYGSKVDFVAFESRTGVRNTARAPLTKETGAVSIWTLGQLPVRNHSVIIVPFRPGPDSQLGTPLNTEYFKADMIDTTQAPDGHVYDDYWALKDNYALIKANGSVRTKIEMWPKRSLGRMASINLASFSMTIVEFRMYPEREYLASYWLPYEGDPFKGAAISIYVGPREEGAYELETLSPALFLQPDEQYTHVSRTYHLRGDKPSIVEILARHFNADIKSLTQFDRNSP